MAGLVALRDGAELLALVVILYVVLAGLRAAVRKATQRGKTWLQCWADSLLELPFRMRLGRFGRPTDVQAALRGAMHATKLSTLCLPGEPEDLSFVERYAKTRTAGMAALGGLEYSPLGHVIVQTAMQRRMEVRLRFVDYLTRNPQIAQLQLKDPIFVIGFPRTGTTFLHELLGLHPKVRMHYTWEQIDPVPGVGGGGGGGGGGRGGGRGRGGGGGTEEVSAEEMRRDRLRRYRKNKFFFSVLRSLLGDAVQSIHRIGYDEPEECTTPISMELPWAVSELPLHVAAPQLLNDGAGQAFRYYRRYLQMLSWQNPLGETLDAAAAASAEPRFIDGGADKTWMLKCPFHPPYLDALLEEFPRATIVWTHRDPVECVASACSLYETLACVAVETTSLDRRKLGAAVLDYTELALKRALDALASPAAKHANVLHIRYADNVKDPVKICNQVLTKAGIIGGGGGGGGGSGQEGDLHQQEWSTRVQAYIAKNKAERLARGNKQQAGKLHDYCLADYGLSEASVRDRFKTYCDKYA